MAGYSAFRIFEESLRVDPSEHFLGLRLNMYVASVLTVVGVAWFIYSQRRGRPASEMVARRPDSEDADSDGGCSAAPPATPARRIQPGGSSPAGPAGRVRPGRSPARRVRPAGSGETARATRHGLSLPGEPGACRGLVAQRRHRRASAADVSR